MVVGDKEKTIRDLREGLKDLKRELQSTRDLIDKHMEKNKKVESHIINVQHIQNKTSNKWKDFLSSKEGQAWINTYRLLREKGDSSDTIKQKLVARGNNPKQVEALLDALEKVTVK
ncbi:MAG: hypothetical protein ABH950_08500 [Candidatus Altiarchaeota archaeon]